MRNHSQNTTGLLASFAISTFIDSFPLENILQSPHTAAAVSPPRTFVAASHIVAPAAGRTALARRTVPALAPASEATRITDFRPADTPARAARRNVVATRTPTLALGANAASAQTRNGTACRSMRVLNVRWRCVRYVGGKNGVNMGAGSTRFVLAAANDWWENMGGSYGVSTNAGQGSTGVGSMPARGRAGTTPKCRSRVCIQK
jgi:hypothetical protein